MKQQLYVFHSTWLLPATKHEVWQALTDRPFSWQQWWPELNDVRSIHYAKGLSGTSFSCTWRSPSGYRLRSDIIIGATVPAERVSLHADGDLRGTVTCRLSTVDDQTKVDISWHVQTTKAWMNYAAPLLRPIFVWSHHAVMRSGERGLRRYLTKKL